MIDQGAASGSLYSGDLLVVQCEFSQAICILFIIINI